MAVKIRFGGAKKKPFYQIVVTDERSGGTVVSSRTSGPTIEPESGSDPYRGDPGA